MKGTGKYDELAEYALQKAEAEFAVVLIMGGRLGSGFAVSAKAQTLFHNIHSLPTILRHMADEIEKDLQGGKA